MSTSCDSALLGRFNVQAGGLRGPLQERLFLIFGEARRAIEQCVISGRRRTSANVRNKSSK